MDANRIKTFQGEALLEEWIASIVQPGSLLNNVYVLFRYKGWFDAWQQIFRNEGVRGFFRGALPRVLWFVPASAVSFMAVEWLRKEFNTPTTVHIDSQSVHSNDTLSDLSSQSQIESMRVNPAQEQ